LEDAVFDVRNGPWWTLRVIFCGDALRTTAAAAPATVWHQVSRMIAEIKAVNLNEVGAARAVKEIA
jgi:hypothetical protein